MVTREIAHDFLQRYPEYRFGRELMGRLIGRPVWTLPTLSRLRKPEELRWQSLVGREAAVTRALWTRRSRFRRRNRRGPEAPGPSWRTEPDAVSPGGG